MPPCGGRQLRHSQTQLLEWELPLQTCSSQWPDLCLLPMLHTIWTLWHLQGTQITSQYYNGKKVRTWSGTSPAQIPLLHRSKGEEDCQAYQNETIALLSIGSGNVLGFMPRLFAFFKRWVKGSGKWQEKITSCSIAYIIISWLEKNNCKQN